MTFLVDGRILRRLIDLANAQMDCFKEKIERLMRNLLGGRVDLLKWLVAAKSKWSRNENVPTFQLREITLDEMIKLISRLSNLTAFGVDLIDVMSVKLATQHLAKPIKHLINVSLMEGTYASKWKLAKIFPLLKDKELDKLNPLSYRLEAILPTLSKLVDRAAYSQLLGFLEDMDQMNPNSHAYRVGYSTMTTLLEVTNKLYEATEKRQMTSIMTIDQHAAFDCVFHRVLLDKLKLYKVGSEPLKWFCCYLDGRTQFVNVGRANSRMETLKEGVPQGSILGPLLYSDIIH